MTNRAIPKITVRIDRGEDWVELIGDWQEKYPVMCGGGASISDWIDYAKIYAAYDKLNEAVME